MTFPPNPAANSSGSSPRVSTPSSEASDALNLIKWAFATGSRTPRENAPAGAHSYWRRQRSGRPYVRLPPAFPLSQSPAWSQFPFGRTVSIAPHRLVDLASPSIDAAVEVACVVKAGASEKVDDHLTASAMMADDHQQLIVGKSSVRAGISAVGICKAPSSRQISSSLAFRTSRTA